MSFNRSELCSTYVFTLDYKLSQYIQHKRQYGASFSYILKENMELQFPMLFHFTMRLDMHAALI